MKKGTSGTRITVIALTTLLVTSASLPVFAGDTMIYNQPKLTYFENEQEQPVFLLNLRNPEMSEFLISIKDAAGDVLYSEKIKGQMITKRFRLADEADIDDLRFEVLSLASQKTTVYKISRNIRFIEDVVIHRQ